MCISLCICRSAFVYTPLLLFFLVAYRTDEGAPWVLPVVRTIEAQMGTDSMLNHEYLPLDGLKAFTEAATRLVLGNDSPAITQNRVSCKYTFHDDAYLSSLCMIFFIH